MENLNAKTARQVWQRVTAPPAHEPEHTLAGLTLYAWETAALYQALANALTGKSREQARALWERQQDTLSCLRGMQRLSSISSGKMGAAKTPAISPAKLITVCCRRARQALTEYTARSIDPEFGPIFHRLSQREEENCAALASLLGQYP